ncbi:hypothetical protein N7534_010345 [Penicillium rubens]|nr:hypothetical protein N7534_010345 [Penicillium rubens]
MPKKVSTRPSKPRRGFCEYKDDVCEDTTHIAAMNKYTQRALTMRSRHVALPYYDEVKYDTNGKLIALPAERRLSDTLVFLVIGHDIVAKRNRYAKWPADFDLNGYI